MLCLLGRSLLVCLLLLTVSLVVDGGGAPMCTCACHSPTRLAGYNSTLLQPQHRKSGAQPWPTWSNELIDGVSCSCSSGWWKWTFGGECSHVGLKGAATLWSVIGFLDSCHSHRGFKTGMLFRHKDWTRCWHWTWIGWVFSKNFHLWGGVSYLHCGILRFVSLPKQCHRETRQQRSDYSRVNRVLYGSLANLQNQRHNERHIMQLFYELK